MARSFALDERSEREERLNLPVGAAWPFGDLQGDHPRESGAPVEQSSGIRSDRGRQPLGACGNRASIVGPPEHKVDGIEGGVTQAGRRIDRNQAALPAAIEDIHRSEITVQENHRGCLGRKAKHARPAAFLGAVAV